MKKILSFVLLACMLLTLAACADKGTTQPEETTPEITLQEVYDAGKDIASLFGDHENVHVYITINGHLIREEYFDKQYHYVFYDSEYMDLGTDYSEFTTDHSRYNYLNDTYAYLVELDTNGMIAFDKLFAENGESPFISEMLLYETPVITEKDGTIIVTYDYNVEMLAMVGDDVVSCEESYIIDANTREMVSVKTVYTYEDGTVEEGIVNIARDVEIPEGMKPFLAFEQNNTETRTITIVSNPGDENEKTDVIHTPKGLTVSFTPYWEIEQTAEAYADAACTQPITGEPDTNADTTVYIKWK